MYKKDAHNLDTSANNSRTKKPKKKRLFSFFLTNASGIFISRIFGFLRDAMQAAILGTSIYSDIFFIAFKFPNMFRRVVSEGAFVQSFLPFFLSARNKGAFSVSIFTIFILLILSITMLVLCFAPFITKILALGYDSEKIELAIPLVKIHFWYLILIFIVTYFSTLLQYRHIFWVNAYNTVLLNLAMIAAMIFIHYENMELLESIYVLSYSVLVGGVLQIILHFYPLYSSKILLLQYVGCKRLMLWMRFGLGGNSMGKQNRHCEERSNEAIYNIPIKIDSTNQNSQSNNKGICKCGFAPSVLHASASPRNDKGEINSQPNNINTESNSTPIQKYKENLSKLAQDIKEFFKAFLPAMLGASSAQIISIIDSSLVTLLPDSEGGVSILNFANRVFQLPLALFAIAISSALFPMVAKAIKNNEIDNAMKNLKTAFWFLLITLSLCILGGIMLRNEIIWLLFERRNFTRNDTYSVAYAFVGYMIGLLPFGLVKIFSLWMYANKQQAKAAKISVISLLIGTILAAGFILSTRYFEILQQGILWDYRYFIIALSGSIGGFVLLFLTIKEFGFSNFLVIISDKKYSLLSIFLLCAAFLVLKIFTYYFHIE